MVRALEHRGPDDAGTWEDRGADLFLGFRRLSILDLSEAGHQPMASRSGRYVITFNGEIYNFKELQAELGIPSAELRGGSDTEVLLECMDRWGVDRTLRKLRGMFAFALFDTRARVLRLARDRVGIKPLYVLHGPQGLAFASEARAFHACPLFSGRGDREAARDFLERLYVPAPASILAGVEQLGPGEVRTFRLEERGVAEIARDRYWDLSSVADTPRQRLISDEVEAVDALNDLLRDSVRQRLIADVPIGAFLSGGIDSSVVVSIMQELSSEPVRTFTIGFDDPRFDESTEAAAVADLLGTSHTSVCFSETEVLDLIPSLPLISDEPMANPSLLPTMLVSRVARRDVVVALSGDGGDELFGGYNRYVHGARLIRWAGRTPPMLRRAAARLLEGVSATPLSGALRRATVRGPVGEQHSAEEQAIKVARVLRATDELSAYRTLMSVGMGDLLTPERSSGEEPRGGASAWKGSTLEDRMMLLDQLDYLPNDLLTKVDRASMWESLEARVPMLDHAVVEFSWRLPSSLKIRDGHTKWPLRRIAARYLPASQLDRPKMGFTVPIARWLRRELREWARDTLQARAVRDIGVCDPDRIESAWTRFEEGHDYLGLPLWTAAVLHGWCQEWRVHFD